MNSITDWCAASWSVIPNGLAISVEVALYCMLRVETNSMADNTRVTADTTRNDCWRERARNEVNSAKHQRNLVRCPQRSGLQWCELTPMIWEYIEDTTVEVKLRPANFSSPLPRTLAIFTFQKDFAIPNTCWPTIGCYWASPWVVDVRYLLTNTGGALRLRPSHVLSKWKK